MDHLSGVTWCKSSYSGGNGGECVEVAVLPDATHAVRDSKNPEGPALTFSAAEWRRFTASVRKGYWASAESNPAATSCGEAGTAVRGRERDSGHAAWRDNR